MTNNYRHLNGFCNFVTLNEKNEAKVTMVTNYVENTIHGHQCFQMLSLNTIALQIHFLKVESYLKTRRDILLWKIII